MADRLLGVKEVNKILGRKDSYSYKIMKKLNNELKEQGYFVNNGKIPAKYFYKRIGLDYDEEEQ